MIEKWDEALKHWGAWMRDHKLPGASGGVSIEYRLMRTAPSKKTMKRVTVAWSCCQCGFRSKSPGYPRECKQCRGIAFQQVSIPVLSCKATKPQRRDVTMPDDPLAETMDKAIAKLDYIIIRAIKLKYMAGFSDEVSARYMNMGVSRFKKWVNVGHYCLDSYFKGAETKVKPDTFQRVKTISCRYVKALNVVTDEVTKKLRFSNTLHLKKNLEFG